MSMQEAAVGSGTQQIVPHLRTLCSTLFQQLSHIAISSAASLLYLQPAAAGYNPPATAAASALLQPAGIASCYGLHAGTDVRLRNSSSLQTCNSNNLLQPSTRQWHPAAWTHMFHCNGMQQACVASQRLAHTSSNASAAADEMHSRVPKAAAPYESILQSQSQLADIEDTLKLAACIRRFRSRGHLIAQLDPLKRTAGGPWLGPIGDQYSRSDNTLMRLVSGYPAPASSTEAERCAFIAAQLNLEGAVHPDRRFLVGRVMPRAAEGPSKPLWSLHECIEVMSATYCGSLAVEYRHLQQQDEVSWMEERFEARRPLTPAQKRQVLRWLLAAHGFEQFLSRKFPASKRFGLEGCEALLPGLLALVEAGAAQGLKKVEVAAAHRGRLSLLVNLLGKPLGALCSEMEGKQSDFRVGDVKYHLGQSGVIRVGPERTPVHVSIAPNPSHLEAVSPVVLGLVRAEQAALHRSNAVNSQAAAWAQVMPLQIHGDAAFAGLGVVLESLQLVDVPGFTVGGSVHVIINNQVGFTTLPRHGRSSPHPSDVAKVIGAPVLHANADDPEAVVAAMQMAADWRARWHKDVVVDIVGYRRNGHNELDDPRATLPLTYQLVENHPTVLEIYSRQLQAEGVMSGCELSRWRSSWTAAAEEQWVAASEGKYKETAAQFLVSTWQGNALASVSRSGSQSPEEDYRQEPTGLPLTTLQRVGQAICTLPEGFNCHQDVSS
eukprot:GHRR01034006.1.p1 GENE.GHRR01034006.1~~GHRR01034006.1.p1  ORF type:complete len:719 (+),score=247.47 GHRR01034006.1:550-2706(+)